MEKRSLAAMSGASRQPTHTAQEDDYVQCRSDLLQQMIHSSRSSFCACAPSMLLQLLALAFSAAGNAAILFSDTSDSAPSAGSRNLSIAADERKKRS